MENNTCEKLNLRQLKYQYLAVICGQIELVIYNFIQLNWLTITVNLVTFCQGFSLGWVTPTLQILQSENSPLESGPITLEETILLGVLPAVGGLAGTLLFSILSNYLGRIVSISLLIFPNMVCTCWSSYCNQFRENYTILLFFTLCDRPSGSF